MSIVTCYYHTNQRAEFICKKCQKPVCHECKHNDLCTICHYSASSYTKTIIGFIGATLFFSPFFGGVAMLIAVIINLGFFWFLILFGIAWIGGVAVGYISILASFIKSMANIRKERRLRHEFQLQVNVDKHGNRIKPYNPCKTKIEVERENFRLHFKLHQHTDKVALLQINSKLLQNVQGNQVFCYKCGKLLPSDAIYCLQCGVHLDYSRLLD